MIFNLIIHHFFINQSSHHFTGRTPSCSKVEDRFIIRRSELINSRFVRQFEH